MCDRLLVAVDSDSMVEAAKGPGRPIIPEKDRLALVNSLGCVDAAFLMYGLGDFTHAAITFGVSKVFKHEGFRRPGRVWGLEGGAELVIVPDVEGLASTTEIIGRIRK